MRQHVLNHNLVKKAAGPEGFPNECESPQQQIAATGFFRLVVTVLQSRNATFFMAFDCASVFIKT